MSSNRNISAFCHIEKTGGTTIIKLLRSRLGSAHVDVIPFLNRSQFASEFDLRYAKLTNPFLKSVAGHSIRPCADHWNKWDISWSALLRDPSERYVSDFFHFTRHMSFPNDFELWLRWRERWNFQTEALVGNGPVELAIEMYKGGNLILGTLPRINYFASALLGNCGFNTEDSVVDLGITNKGVQGRTQSEQLLDEYSSDIRENNKLDWQLYSKVVEVESSLIEEMPENTVEINKNFLDRTNINKAWRNLVYKPATLQNPFKTHGLKEYKRYALWQAADWVAHIK